ncbi:amidase family protein [Saccharospirillum salsuginis]|uniref:Amidase domain-containing protein n=1 Tax=Saccharospirillum salsuginis TaxID=418750 RepID=A0A918KKD5_9GAMM|nr:amidase family protein [Saccharospirillum salsuginis]GGX66735.1 hypothetical protein GCM10007392_38110 [Saccharospirillum salsuginis]
MSDTQHTVKSLSEELALGRADPVDVVEEALARAAASESVFISLLEERARFEAEQSRARQRAGRRLGPLDGVPVAWKDVFDVAGSVTTGGSRVLNHPAEADSECARLAGQAGLVPVGKTNMTELAFSGLGMNPHFGTPHHTPGEGAARVPGGSSSGSAVAVAQGIVPVATGSDTAGSLRIPAAFNGLYSYRPTVGRMPMAGVLPLARSLDTVGTLARTLGDCLWVTEAMRTGCAALPEPMSRAALTLVFDENALDSPLIQGSVKARMLEVARKLEEAGIRVVRRRVSAVRETLAVIDRYGWLGGYEALAEYRDLLEHHPAEAFDPRVRNRILAVGQQPPDRAVVLYRERERLQRALAQELEGAFLLSPTVAHAAPELAPLVDSDDLYMKTNLDTLKLTMVASFLDCPAVAMPAGTDADGQYLSVQLSAPRGDDNRVLRAALAVDSV